MPEIFIYKYIKVFNFCNSFIDIINVIMTMYQLFKLLKKELNKDSFNFSVCSFCPQTIDLTASG